MLLGGNNELIDHQEYKYVWGKDEDRDFMYNIITRNVYSMFVFFSWRDLQDDNGLVVF